MKCNSKNTIGTGLVHGTCFCESVVDSERKGSKAVL